MRSSGMYRKRMFRRRMRVPRPVGGDRTITLVRSTQPSSVALVAGAVAFNQNVTLNQIQTSDLTPTFSQFRIVKATIYLFPAVDPGNSGVVNNTNVTIATCCDPEGAGGSTIQAISAFSNAKIQPLTVNSPFVYTFYPKALNTVDASGVATAAGSYAQNPWLTLNGAGITIPHLRLFGAILSSQPAAVTVYSFFIKYHFQVRGIS